MYWAEREKYFQNAIKDSGGRREIDTEFFNFCTLEIWAGQFFYGCGRLSCMS